MPDRTSTDVLACLETAAAALARGQDVDGILATLLAAAVPAAGAGHAVLVIQHPDRPDLELAATAGLDADAVDALRTALRDHEHPVARVVGSGEAGERRAADGSLSVDLPLVVGRDGIEMIVGAATFTWPAGHDRTEAGERLARAVADLAAVAVDRARLASTIAERSEWFERLAHTDPLTGLANQRTFARVLELELARASRQASEVSVAIVDVDGLGTINEVAGRAAGDDVLRGVAAIVAESVRLVDTVARHGGDEFVVVAPGSAGVTVARRILEAVKTLPDVGDRRVSVSVGVARFPADGTSADELLVAATNALAASRASGSGGLAEASGQPTA